MYQRGNVQPQGNYLVNKSYKVEHCCIEPIPGPPGPIGLQGGTGPTGSTGYTGPPPCAILYIQFHRFMLFTS